jgi:plastocyanin
MRRTTACLLLAALLSTSVARASGQPSINVALALRHHRFVPDSLTVPAGRRIVITLINEDSASEEFDSSDLRVEEDVTPKARIVFTVGPLRAGTYRFMGEAHPATALGQIVVTPTP